MIQLSRRQFAASAAAASLLSFAPLQAAAEAKAAVKKAVPISQVQLGRFQISVIADGYIDAPYNFFTGISEKDAEAAVKAIHADRGGKLRLGFACYLVNDNGRLVLIDTGPAGTVSPTSGWLPQALAQLGVTPDQIEAVIITHTHIDHFGGLIAGGKINFPNADIYVDRRDIAFFNDQSNFPKSPEITKTSFEGTQQLVKLAKRLQQIDGEREIAKGISVIDLSGHTPGQIGVRIEDGGESIIMVSDMLFHPVAHPGNAKIGFFFEHDKEAADASRASFFPRAAEEKALLAATHIPFPGLGRIVKDGEKLSWLPADWQYGG